ncbi:hypothetical protein OIU85_005468 [Salix viminalis]|uniref:Uncharacterized protein n=1 Tax=Salix viminalis TaxID=40686 RepID=A0A9Q0ST39_SALVM|nr:hypothetical protein OIU85_005468 [Salix viminalis]
MVSTLLHSRSFPNPPQPHQEIKLEKPVGYVIMDFLDKLVKLMVKEFGSTTLLAKVDEIVVERAREEAEVLRDEGEMEERMVTELFRVF